MIKERLKNSFSKSAATYDEHAGLQREIEDKLIAKLHERVTAPGMILDIGAGTATGSRKLARLYPAAKVVVSDLAHGMMKHAKRMGNGNSRLLGYVTADMERLPFKERAFDVVYSSAAVHWTTGLDELFMRARAILKDNGTFSFSTFGADTLYELDRSFDEAYVGTGIHKTRHVNVLMPYEEIVIKLKRAGFTNIVSEVEKKRVTHLDVMELLRTLKAIGSLKTDQDTHYLRRDFLQKVFTAYEERFKAQDGIYATYMVYYFICKTNLTTT